jgi:hypothetical protein
VNFALGINIPSRSLLLSSSLQSSAEVPIHRNLFSQQESKGIIAADRKVPFFGGRKSERVMELETVSWFLLPILSFIRH